MANTTKENTGSDYLQSLIDLKSDAGIARASELLDKRADGTLDITTLSAPEMQYLAAHSAMRNIEETQNVRGSGYSEATFLSSTHYTKELENMVLARAEKDIAARGTLSPEADELLDELKCGYSARMHVLLDTDRTQQKFAVDSLRVDMEGFERRINKLGVKTGAFFIEAEARLARESDSDSRIMGNEGGGINNEHPAFGILAAHVFGKSELSEISAAQAARTSSDIQSYVGKESVREAGVLNQALKDLARNGMIDDAGNIQNPDAAKAIADMMDYMREHKVSFDASRNVDDVQFQTIQVQLDLAIRDNKLTRS